MFSDDGLVAAVEAERAEVQDAAHVVEQGDGNRLAVHCRLGGNAEIEAELIDANARAAITRDRRYTHNLEMRRRDGETFWCTLSGQRIDPADPASPTVWVLQDISDRLHAEEQLRRANARLEQMVQARTRSLERSNATLAAEIERRRAAQLALTESREKYRTLFRKLPLGLLVYGVVAFLLLDGAVPDESLFDLVGSPILDWPGQWEIALRWMALLAVPGALIYLAAQSVRRWRGKPLGALHFWAALPVVALAYWAVVVEAATDNLVELIATPSLPAWLALSGWLYLLCLAAALLASPLMKAERPWAWGVAGLSLPLGGLLLYLGLAQDIDKYGQHFSAMQFLLSRDRQHYASPMAVWLRYAGLHVLVIAALAFLQWPHFRAGRRRIPEPSRP